MKSPLTTTSKGPSYKYRGLRKYFRRVHRDASTFEFNPGPADWWDFWHYHADWPGLGNVSPRYRLEHIKALAQVFENISKKAGQFSTPFQAWVMLDGEDAGQDATYLHTPNPNGSVFPWVNPEVRWGITDLDSVLAECFPQKKLRVGWVGRIYDSEDGDPPEFRSNYFIYCPGIGVPLE